MNSISQAIDDMMLTRLLTTDQDSIGASDAEMSQTILTEFARFAEQEILPLNQLADKKGCIQTPQGVSMPAEFKTIYAQLAEAGWQGLSAPAEFGGMELDKLTAAGVSELFSSACHALQMVCNLVPGAIAILNQFGSDDQRIRLIPPLAEGRWLATMCLSEPAAGSDLSRISCIARKGDGFWELSGEKIFISGGDQDISSSILHFVLARTESAEKGIKGLSLFACPKHLQDTLNNISVLRLEDKLGIHASPTCHMRFDRARAELIGQAGQGLQAMFTLMNHARLDVALQGIAHAQQAWQLSHHYASERQQGRKTDKSPALLTDHPDVMRMLNEQRALTLGGRAICYQTFAVIEDENNAELAEFLTPLCKVFCSEAGIRAADLGIQIMGGYGYLREYQIEQHWRDVRITSIYEGANGIHSKMMVTRNLHIANGRAADQFDQLITKLSMGDAEISRWRLLWKYARMEVEQAEKPEEFGYDFTQFSARLLFEAIWCKLSTDPRGALLFTSELRNTVRNMPWAVRPEWLNPQRIEQSQEAS